MLHFRATNYDDLDGILFIERHPENVHWICPYTRERHIGAIDSEVEFHYVIEDKRGQMVGFIILAITEKEAESIEFRRIAIRDKGKGYGRETIRWIKDWAFNKMGAHRLWLDVFTDNDRARALYRSEGFVEEGVKRESIQSGEGRRSQLIMSILSNEYHK